MRNNLLRIVLIVLIQMSLWVGTVSSAQALTEDQKLFNDAWRIVNQAYVDETFNHQNWWAIREKKLKPPFHDRHEAYEAIRSILGTLDDPFTRFLQPAQYRSLRTSTSGELSGVGAPSHYGCKFRPARGFDSNPWITRSSSGIKTPR